MSANEPEPNADHQNEISVISKEWNLTKRTADTKNHSGIVRAPSTSASSPRRRASSWDDSDDESMADSNSQMPQKHSADLSYSRDIEKSHGKSDAMISESRNLRKSAFVENTYRKTIEPTENLGEESEAKLKINKEDRRQSSARVRRRAKSLSTSSDATEIKNTESPSEALEKLMDNGGSELNSHSTSFLETFITELRSRRIETTPAKDSGHKSSAEWIHRDWKITMETSCTGSHLERGRDPTEINEGTSTVEKDITPIRTSRKLSRILEVEEIKKDLEDESKDTRTNIINNEESIFSEKQSHYEENEGKKEEINRNNGDNYSDKKNSSPLSTDRGYRPILSDEYYTNKLFSKPLNSTKPKEFEKNFKGSISDRSESLYKRLDNDNIISLTPKSAKTEIGLTRESDLSEYETLEKFLSDYPITSTWIESFLEENKMQHLQNNLKIDLKIQGSEESSPRKSKENTFRSEDVKSKSSAERTSRFAMESPKFMISIGSESSRSLKVEDVETSNSDINVNEERISGVTLGGESGGSLESAAKNLNSKINRSERSITYVEDFGLERTSNRDSSRNGKGILSFPSTAENSPVNSFRSVGSFKKKKFPQNSDDFETSQKTKYQSNYDPPGQSTDSLTAFQLNGVATGEGNASNRSVSFRNFVSKKSSSKTERNTRSVIVNMPNSARNPETCFLSLETTNFQKSVTPDLKNYSSSLSGIQQKKFKYIPPDDKFKAEKKQNSSTGYQSPKIERGGAQSSNTHENHRERESDRSLYFTGTDSDCEVELTDRSGGGSAKHTTQKSFNAKWNSSRNEKEAEPITEASVRSCSGPSISDPHFSKWNQILNSYELSEDALIESKSLPKKQSENSEIKTDESFDLKCSEESLKEYKKINTKSHLDENSWNELINAFDGSAESERSSHDGQSTSESKECVNCPTGSERKSLFRNGNSDDENDFFHNSIRIIKRRERGQNPNKKKNDNLPSEDGKKEAVEHFEKQIIKGNHLNSQRHTKELMYRGTNEKEKMRIGEFGDITCFNVVSDEFETMQLNKPKDKGSGDQEQVNYWQPIMCIPSSEKSQSRKPWTNFRSDEDGSEKQVPKTSSPQEVIGGNMKTWLPCDKKFSKSDSSINENFYQMDPKSIHNLRIKSNVIYASNVSDLPISEKANKSELREEISSENLQSVTVAPLNDWSNKQNTKRLFSSFMDISNLIESDNFSNLESNESTHSLEREFSEEKITKEKKELDNLNIFLAKATMNRPTKENNWLIIKNSTEKDNKYASRKNRYLKSKKNNQKNTIEKHGNTRSIEKSSTKLKKIRNSHCFQNLYNRLIRIFCVTSVSSTATSE